MDYYAYIIAIHLNSYYHDDVIFQYDFTSL